MGPKHNDAELYLRIAKKLAVDLPNEKDRVLALKWLKFLQKSEELAEKKTKLHVIQLLLICLKRGRLVGPFAEAPEPNKKLRQYGWAYQPADIARLIVKSEYDRIGKIQFFNDISGDMCEYVATQDIPQFGMHFYYAYSPENVSLWDGLNREYIPKGILSVSTIQSPDASILATTIAQTINERKHVAAARVVVPVGDKKRTEFTAASIVDEMNGKLHNQFLEEVPPAKDVDMDVLQHAVKRGIIQPDELASPLDKIGVRTGQVSTESEAKKRIQHGTVNVASPLVETVEIKDGNTTIMKTRKVKNAATRKVEKKTRKLFDAIQEEEEEDKANQDLVKRTKEQEAKRQEMFSMLPERLRKRMLEQKKKKEKKAKDAKIKTPEAFRKDSKGIKFKRVHKPEEFGLSATEKFDDPLRVFANLEYKSPDEDTRKTVWIGKDIPSEERKRQLARLGLTGQSRLSAAAPTPLNAVEMIQETPTKSGASFAQKDIEASWDRSLKKMRARKAERESRSSEDAYRQAILDRLHRLKTAQPRRIIFDDMDHAVQPEETSFKKFVFSEFPDEDKTPSILEDSNMEFEDIFGEGQIASVSHLETPLPIEELEKAEILLDAEMETADVFGQEDVADPSVVFKEVAVEGERQAFPTQESKSLREGGVKIGKRVMQITGQKPMEQHYIQTYGDVVFNESLKATDPASDPQSHTPPMNDEILNRYLDQKLKSLRPGESPRVYGPWAQSFKKDLERLERGEELDDFPEEDAAKYIYPHDAHKSILSESEMDVSGAFGEDKIAIPSPVLLADARRQSEVFSKWKNEFEAKKARQIQKAPPKPLDEQDLLEPYIYDSLPEDRQTLLDASITDAGLGLALAEAPKTPVRTNPLDSFEKKLDQSLALLAEDDREDESAPLTRIVYDVDFLNKKIMNEELPAEDSIIVDIDVDDLFGEENLAEPLKMKDIPEYSRPRSPQKLPSPARYSHLYLAHGKYRSKVEDIVPHDFLDEQSFPEDKFLDDGFELSPAESSISEITPPTFASGISSLTLLERSRTESQVDKSDKEGEEGCGTSHDILNEEDMPTDDVFGADRIRTPSPIRRISPTSLALAISIQQTRNAQKMINKYRQSRGLPPQEIQIPFQRVAQYLETRESLLDPLVQETMREQFPGLIDEPILDNDLAKPLINSPKKQDPFADYEEKIIDEMIAERAAKLDDVALLSEGEMDDDMFAEELVSSPPPIHELPMPSPKKSVKQAGAPTPLEHSHLFLTKPPLKPIVPREPPPEIIDEKLEDESPPELEEDGPEHELSGRYELSSENQELLKILFDGDVPSSMIDGFGFRTPEKGEFLGEGDRSGYSPIIGRFRKLKEQNKRKSKEIIPAPASTKITPLDWLPDDELYIDDVFGEGQILSPRQVQKSPTLLILNRSIQMSKDLLALKNKFRTLKNQPPIEEPVDMHHVDRIKEAEEALRHILAEPIVNEEETLSKTMARGRAILERIEKDIEESEQHEAEGKEPSFIGSEELSDLLDDISISEPPPLKEIPMPIKPKTMAPAPPVDFSHLKMPRKYRLPLPYDLPQEDLRKEEFPKDISDDILELIPIGYETQLEAEEEPSFEEPPPLRRVYAPQPPRQSAFFDTTPPQHDLYYNLLRSPEGWRQPLAVQAIMKSVKDSQIFTSLKNKFRSMKNLPPIEEDEEQKARLLLLAKSVLEEQHIAELPPSPTTPRTFVDPFQSFEELMEKELYPSPPPPERSLISQKDIDDVFGEAQILTPPHIRDLPMTSPKPALVKSSTSPKTPPTRSSSPLRAPFLVKPYKPELASILPHELILEQSFPSADESVLDYLPSPKIEDIPPPEMIDDAELPAYEEPLENDDVLGEAEMPTDDLFGESRVLSPEEVAVSPTQLILARSLRVSEDYRNLKNKVRAMSGLPPVEEQFPTKHLKEFLEQTANLLEPIRRQKLPPEWLSLMDEPVLETQPMAPLLSPPRKKDLFADYERQLDKELFPSPPPPERSLIGEDEFEDLFPEDAFVTPPPIRTLPMPSAKPCPFPVSKSPHIPSHQMDQRLSRRLAVTVATPASKSYEASLYDDSEILQETPPKDYAATGLDSPISPVVPVFLPSESLRESSLTKEIRVKVATPKEMMESPTRRTLPRRISTPLQSGRTPTPARPAKLSSPQLYSPPTPEEAYTPIRLDFEDDIGSPKFEDSPGIIQFREIFPGVYEPARDVDQERFAEREKRMIANKFRISPEAIPDELLEQLSPPKLNASLGSPELEALLFGDKQVIPLPDTPKLKRSAKVSPKQLFPREQLPLQLSPQERMKQFLAQQPVIKVEPLPRKTGLSPQDFVTKVLAPREENLEEQEFPQDENFRPSLELGPLANALFYPTEKDISEAENLERERAEKFRTPPSFKYATPAPRQTPEPPREDITPVSPIVTIPDVLPHERGFKWLDNYQPFPDEFVPAELLKMQESPPPEKFQNKKWKRLNSEQVAILRRASDMRKKRQTKVSEPDVKSRSRLPEKKKTLTKPKTKMPSQTFTKPVTAPKTPTTPDKPTKFQATPRLSLPAPPTRSAIRRPSQRFRQQTSTANAASALHSRPQPFSSPPPPPGTAIRPRNQYIKLSSSTMKDPSASENPPIPPLPGKLSQTRPVMVSSTKSRSKAPPILPGRRSLAKIPQSVSLSSTPSQMRPTPGSVGRKLKSQSVSEATESAPKIPPAPKLYTSSIGALRRRSTEILSVAPLPRVATIKRPSEPTVRLRKAATQDPHPASSIQQSQPSMQKPRSPPGIAASGSKSQVTFKSPSVPHWQISPRMSQPLLQPPGFRLSGILKPRPASSTTGRTSVPTNTSGIPSPTATPRRAKPQGSSASSICAPKPPSRSSIPKPVQRYSSAAAPSSGKSSFPASGAMEVVVDSRHIPSPTGAHSSREQQGHDIQSTAGHSNSIWQPQKPSIQAGSFIYRIPSMSPVRPLQQQTDKQITEPHPTMKLKPNKNITSKKQKVRKPATIIGLPPAPINTLDSRLWAFHEQQKPNLRELELKLKQTPPQRPKRTSRLEEPWTQLEQQVEQGKEGMKKSSFVQQTRIPPPRPPPIREQQNSAPRVQEQQVEKSAVEAAVDRRTLRQMMTVGKAGKENAVCKEATIEMHLDVNQPGSKMIKTNVLRSIKPGEVKKVESKLAIRHIPKPSHLDRAPQLPHRKKN